jgi:hypothetical protein
VTEQWYLTPVRYSNHPQSVRVHLWFRDEGVRYAVVYWLNDHGQKFFDVREEKFLTPCDEEAAKEAA